MTGYRSNPRQRNKKTSVVWVDKKEDNRHTDIQTEIAVIWGACGKNLAGLCYPDEVLETCPFCDYNGHEHKKAIPQEEFERVPDEGLECKRLLRAMRAEQTLDE